MIARILEQITAIHLVLSADHKCYHPLPTWQDTEVLEVINKVLSPLADLTDLLSGEKYVSVSSIKTVINHIHSDALSAKGDDVSLAKDIKCHICTDLDSRYLDTKIKTLLDIPSFLDPRFKMEHVAEEDRITTKEKVIEEGSGVLSTLTEEEVMVESQPLSTDLDETEQPPATKRSKLARILKHSSKDSDDPQLITPRDKVRKEVQYYIDTPCLDVEEDPLQCMVGFCIF